MGPSSRNFLLGLHPSTFSFNFSILTMVLGGAILVITLQNILYLAPMHFNNLFFFFLARIYIPRGQEPHILFITEFPVPGSLSKCRGLSIESVREWIIPLTAVRMVVVLSGVISTSRENVGVSVWPLESCKLGSEFWFSNLLAAWRKVIACHFRASVSHQ